MPRSKSPMSEAALERMAAWVIGGVRAYIPADVGITVVLHNYHGDDWSLSSTAVDPGELHRVIVQVAARVAANKDQPIQRILTEPDE